MKGAAFAAPFFVTGGRCSDSLFGEVFLPDRIVMPVRIGLHFETGEFHFGSVLEVVIFVYDRRGGISPRGRAEKEAYPYRRVQMLPECHLPQCKCHNSHPLSGVRAALNGCG